MPGFIKQTFIFLVLMLGFGGLLALKCISVNNQERIPRPTLIDLKFDELRQYSFIISLDWDDGFCKFAGEPFWQNKIEDVNLKSIIMIKGINESKILTKCRYGFDGRKRFPIQKWNSGKCHCEYKKPVYEKLPYKRLCLDCQYMCLRV